MSQNPIQFYNKPKEFWHRHSQRLLSDPARYSLILGNLKSWKEDLSSKIYCGEIKIKNEEDFIFMVCQFGPNQILLPGWTLNNVAIDTMVGDLVHRSPALNAVVCDGDMAPMIQQAFKKQGYKIKILVQQGVYKCTKVKIPKVAQNTKFRQAVASDFAQLAQWYELFRSEAVPHDPPKNGLEVARDLVEAGRAYLLLVDGAPVSMACWSRAVEDFCAISFVFTPKEFRKNGYGGLITALITNQKFNEGKKITGLYTDMANKTSNKIYQNIGYEWVGPSCHFEIQKEAGRE